MKRGLDQTAMVPTLLTVILLLSACAAGRPAVVTRPPSFDEQPIRLRRDLGAVLSASALDRSSVGIAVQSLDRGDVLYTLNERRLLMPASVMKIVTLAAAAQHLGWNHTFDTQLLASGAVEAGVLDGDLLVVGSGDPSIDDWDGAATSLFGDWAEQLKARGIHAVSGRVIGDDNTFTEDRLGWGWAWDDLAHSYASGSGALQFNQNTAQLIVTPATRAGQPATAVVAPAWAPVTLQVLVTTSDPDVAPSLSLLRAPGNQGLEVHGSVPLGTEGYVRNISVDNPTLYFVRRLREVLAAGGVEVRGPAVDIDDIEAPHRDHAWPLLVHSSPPLSTLAETMMKESQNSYAETLLRAVGNPVGSADAGRQQVIQTLQQWGIRSEGLLIADGSGLSRYNLAAAETVVQILAAVDRDDQLDAMFAGTLPVAGVDGTLASRMKGTSAEGNVRAKTGSFSNAAALAGYVSTADGERLAFCIMANNFGAPSSDVWQALDAIAVRLATFSRR